MTISLNLIFLFSVLLVISLGFNFFLLVLITRKKEKIAFEEAFSILNSSIDVHKKKFLLGLKALSKKYAVLSNDGMVKPPTDAVQKYAKDKQELKITIVKKIVRCLSINIRNSILLYYSESGMVDYIISELDKYDIDTQPSSGGGNEQ